MKRYLIFILIWTISVPGYAQSGNVSAIEAAITAGHFQQAQAILNDRIKTFKEQRLPDSIAEYIFIAGKIYASQKNVPRGNKVVEEMIAQVRSLHPGAASLMQAYIEAGEYYGFTGNSSKGYEQNKVAAQYAEQAGSAPSQRALIQNNLCTFAQRSGNIPAAKNHALIAIRLLEGYPHPDFSALYIAQNGMGSMSYYASKLDSAVYYFQAAMQSLKKSPPTPANQFYRVAIIQNNLAGIYNQQGNTSKAIETMYAAISNLERYHNSEDAEPRKKSAAVSLQFEATDNLAGIYKSIGDLARARDLLEYSYNQKRSRLSANDPAIFKSQILLGQLFNDLHEQELSIRYLNQGIANFIQSGNPDPIWTGDGYNTLARIYEDKGEKRQAAGYYHRADSCYLLGLGDVYDETYLDFLRNRARFLAGHGRGREAIEVATRSEKYILKTEGAESFSAFQQLLNFSQIEYLTKNYIQSEAYASKGLRWLNNKIRNASTLVDSIKMESDKPRAIYYQSRARYALLTDKTEMAINGILTEMHQALAIIDRKKSFVNNTDNNRVLLSENKEIFDFVKRLELDLYAITNDPGYVDRIMNLQESFLYTRLRSRLNNDSIPFAHLPKKISLEEKLLDRQLANALAQNDVTGSLRDYKNISNRIAVFRENLKTEFPDYYRLRYQSFLADEQPVQQMIPAGITLLRYFFIDSSLYVLVADKKVKKIVPLQSNNLAHLIEQTYRQTGAVHPIADALFSLYEMLWKPIESSVRNKKIVVIPDGILYSLNMEILTPSRIKGFDDLAKNSLLAKYTFSYNYSIFLLQKQRIGQRYSRVFTGFAPGFSEALKNLYRQSVNDSVRMDYGYLNMLPQPFTTTLLKNLYHTVGGQVYLDGDCTRERFIREAGNSRIIHIGTHAFSDNEYPQYSRLVFTKGEASDENNLLYAQNLYHYSLPSELTVLSACETGKPGYEDGEGMISLANAFNYAGSKSILTGLWKIDEKASAILLEKFYRNLEKGMTKDEALRHAKLSYLNSEHNRMLYPAYWAGLVIIGDTTPVSLTTTRRVKIYVGLSVAIMLLISAGYFYNRMGKFKKR